jgi:gluconate 2-dehydrogenase alpha chain
LVLQSRTHRRQVHLQQLKPVDVVIAGGGFVGLTLAKEVTARTSLNVVVLERAQPRKSSDYASTMDELDHALRFRVIQNLAEETMTHRLSTRASAVPVRQYGSLNPVTGAGGAAEHWGAARDLLRGNPENGQFR